MIANLNLKFHKSALLRSKTSLDLPLITASTLLVIFGLAMIYDASVVAAYRDFGDKLYYFKNQLVWATLGFMALTIFSFVNYHKLVKLAPTLFILALLLLAIVLIPGIGSKIYGARRWINIAGFSFQPSELAKLALIFYETSIISKLQNWRIRIWDALYVLFLPIFLAIVLVLVEPDLGTALIFAGITFVIYFVGQAPIWHLAILIPILTIGGLIAIVVEPYRLTRIKTFLNPNFDPQGASYQINQILIALGSGGLLGVGIGASTGKFDFIPEVHSDAIFAIVAEELGFIGAMLVITVLLFLILRGIAIAKNAKDFQGRLLAIGLTALIASQTILNLASIVALIPLTGIPLPFISYGGSSLLVTMSAIGILNNIKRNS